MTSFQKKYFVRQITPKYFQIGEKLISEGEGLKNIYLIRQGECKVYSSINPAHVKISSTGQIGFIKPVKLPAIKQPMGYKSITTNTCQLGIKGPGQWVGEDLLAGDAQDTHKYSVVA